MSAADHFIWQQGAGVFAADRPVHQCATPAPGGIDVIPALPSRTALSRLGAAVRARRGFCVSDGPLPPGLTVAQGSFLTQSGGTSGAPKLIRRSQASWIASFGIHAARFDLGPRDTTAVLGRLSHSLALFGVLEAMHLGLDVRVLEGLRPATQRARLHDADVTVIYATPAQLRLLLAMAKHPLPGVRLILCGGGALDSATRAATTRLCPNAALHVFYGAAETSFVTMADQTTPDGSVGRAYPGVSLQVRGADDTSGVGEVWVKSPYLFEGYANGYAPAPRRDGDWITVGEQGRIDDAGNLWLRGRTGRMITIADQNVHPEDLETFISAHPDGGPCAVLPQPDAARGWRLTAVLEGADDPARSDRIRTACRAAFGPLVTPRRVVFCAELPVLPSGKTDLRALAAWLEQTA